MHADLLLGDDCGCFIFNEKRPDNFTSSNLHITKLYSQHEHEDRLDRKQLVPGIACRHTQPEGKGREREAHRLSLQAEP